LRVHARNPVLPDLALEIGDGAGAHPLDAGQIARDDLALGLDELAADQHGVHVAALRLVDDMTSRTDTRRPGRRVLVLQRRDVGSLPDLERPNAAILADRPRPAAGG